MFNLLQASEKEEFRNYLEKSGVVDALTKGTLAKIEVDPAVLVGLYEENEKPADALEYGRLHLTCSWIKKHLGSVIGVDIDGLKKENEELKKAKVELSQKVEELSKKV